jgi:hypothetical protein
MGTEGYLFNDTVQTKEDTGHCCGPGDWYKGTEGGNMDECPGAMFIWPFSLQEPDVEAVDAVDNQKLGRDLGRALRAYPQKDQNDLWEVVFQFV